MIHAIRGCMRLRKVCDKKAPYFPCRYMRRQLVWFITGQRDVIWAHKHLSLRSKYGVENNDVFGHPISFKDYCRNLLDRRFWGDDVCLYAFTLMFKTTITVINAVKLEEYRIRHDLPLHEVEIILIFNGRNHYTYAGTFSGRLLPKLDVCTRRM